MAAHVSFDHHVQLWWCSKRAKRQEMMIVAVVKRGKYRRMENATMACWRRPRVFQHCSSDGQKTMVTPTITATRKFKCFWQNCSTLFALVMAPLDPWLPYLGGYRKICKVHFPFSLCERVSLARLSCVQNRNTTMNQKSICV